MTGQTVSGQTVFRGAAFGLVLESNIPVAGMSSVDAACSADVYVEMVPDGGESAWHQPDRAEPWYRSLDEDAGVPWLTVWKGDGYLFEYGEGARFWVSADATRIRATWTSPLVAADAATFLLGPVLAFALRLRGTIPLHASGAVIDGRAVLFVGPAGAGKSTTAAALGRLGHAVVSDDVVPIDLAGPSVLARPGYPRLSLWRDASDAVFGRAGAVPPVSAVYDKRAIDLQAVGVRFSHEPVPIETIFVLGERFSGTGTARVPMSRRAGAMALVANTFGAYLLDRDLRVREFDVVSAAAQRVTFCELRVGDRLGDVARSCSELFA